MNSENFQEGFVQHCVNRGLNQEQTEQLYKCAHLASAFDNKNFRDSFDSRVVKEASSENLSAMKKAILVDEAIRASYDNS